LLDRPNRSHEGKHQTIDVKTGTILYGTTLNRNRKIQLRSEQIPANACPQNRNEFDFAHQYIGIESKTRGKVNVAKRDQIFG